MPFAQEVGTTGDGGGQAVNAGRSLLRGALVATLAWPAAVAADDAAARTALEQRLRLAATLMADSATAQRIVASGNERATAHLDQARVHHALARELLERGDLPAARRAADEVLRHVGLARRLVPDAPARQAAARQRYDKLSATLQRLLEAWRQRLGRADAEDGDLVAAIGLMETAGELARAQRFEEAGHTLAAAESHVLTGMNRLLNARTLDYTQRAATPAEEYQIELERHRGLIELVPLAVRDLEPRPEALALVERYTEASAAMRNQSQARARSGDMAQALADLRNAVLFVQRALTSAGLVMPQATGGAP